MGPWTPAGHRDFRMAPLLVEPARAWLALPPGDRPAPVAPRPAATVMVLRDGEAGVEVFLQTRASTMAFAPSMVVFPGGGVDPRDGEADDHAEVSWSGPTPEQWAARMPGTTPTRARQLVLAAAREVFEETGVLLAARADGTPLTEAEASAPEVVRGRRAVEARELSFSAFLSERGLVVRTECLSVRDHWITPEFEPRRYDTWFFAARIPAGQEPDGATSEAVSAGWARPAEVLDRLTREPGLLLPPTAAALEELAEARSVEAVLSDRAAVPEVLPWPVEVPVTEAAPDGLVMRARWER